MKKPKFSEEQIAFALRMAETGTRVAEVCRKLGFQLWRWYNDYGQVSSMVETLESDFVFNTNTSPSTIGVIT